MLKVSTPDGTLTRLVEASKIQEYLDKGWIIEDTSEVEMMLDADGNTLWRYKEDTEWNTISGGSGTDTYKVKVDGTDTADYLENKLQQGTNVTITKSGGKLVVNSTGGSGGSEITSYNFYQMDEGKSGFIIENDGEGAYIFGGVGTTGSGQNLAIATCDELQGLGKAVRFSLNDATYRPCYFVAANGSYTARTTNFKAIEVQINSSTVIKINKHIGSTITTMKTINMQSYTTASMIDNEGVEIIVRHYGNRIEIILRDKFRGVIFYSGYYEDVDLLTMGTQYGFSNAWNEVSKIYDLEISNFTGFGTNIVFGGDSQQSESYGVVGAGITSKFAKLSKDYNVFVQNTSVVGRYLQEAIDNFATEVVPLYNSNATKNIYSINLGTNDVRSATASVNTSTAMLTRLNSLIVLAKNAGFEINVCTVPVYGLTVAQTTELTAFNAGIRTLKTQGTINYIVDLFDSDYALIDASTGTLYRKYVLPDNLHWNTTCRNKIASAMFAVLSPIFTKYFTMTGISKSKPIGVTLYQMTKIQALDATFTSAQNTKLNSINAVGTAVASAETIAVPANKTIFHVTGTTAISTINVPYTGFTGSIVIIPDGAFTFAISGNIAETFTATVNRAVEMVFDGTKWYRV